MRQAALHNQSDTMLELYAGIGGVAAAGANIVAAIDHNEFAHNTYTANFDHPAHRLNLFAIKANKLAAFGAERWWMSPPCQPFTVRGKRADVADRRCESLLHLLTLIPMLRPKVLFVENVPGFQDSQAHRLLLDALDGYSIMQTHRCPTALGIPMERRRYYLVATERPLHRTLASPLRKTKPIRGFLDASPDPAMQLDPAFLARFESALHVVDAEDDRGVAACFTSAYGRSPVYAGSYLRRQGKLYRFSPREMARLMGFPEDFVLPEDTARATKLLGNSLTVDVVRELLALV